MFQDEVLDSLNIPSIWREKIQRQRETVGVQTRPLHSSDAEVQSVHTSVGSTQTETQDLTSDLLLHLNPDLPDPPGLVDFLRGVEDLMVQELVSGARSHAFDGFQVNWDEQSQLVSRLHLLHHPAAQDRHLQVTCVSWSCTGAVLTCGYGRVHDGDWSTENSYVCTWNLDRRGLNPSQADLVIEVQAAVTALSCHPTDPALIAGGLYNGEVVVWDSSRTQDPVLVLTGMSADSHREPVYQVSWVPLQKKKGRDGGLGVLSAGSGGRVLLWTLDLDLGRLVLDSAFAFVRQQVPHGAGMKTRGGGGGSSVGVTSLDVSPWDGDTFLVGSEGGLLLRCSFSSTTPAAVPPQGQKVTPTAPAVFSFRPHSGPIHSIHCSPFHRNLFVSAGSEGVAYVHSMLQADALLLLRVSDSSVFQVQWSPSRPLVFAAATGQGQVQIYDLGRQSPRPAATIEQGGVGLTSTCLSFNAKNSRLLAVGNTDGRVGIWRLSDDLVQQDPREMARLEQIANQVSE